jgi:hypothetical protein
MFRRFAVVAGIVAGLSAISATSTMAHSLNANVSADCDCTYTISVDGYTDSLAAVTVDYAFTVTSDGIDYPVSGQIHTTALFSGYYNDTFSGLTLPGSCDDTVQFSAGTANLTFNGFTETGYNVGLPSTLYCSSGNQPGKTFDIGPSSMEGHLLIRPGDWISGGYSFVFLNGGHPATTVTVSSTLTIPFRCADGTSGQFIINLGTHDYNVPALNKSWQPTGDANSVLSWAGAGLAPAGCGPGKLMDNSKGAIFNATVSQNPDTGSLLNWRFKYRDPNAKDKGNVNCLDTSDPRRNKADVCGASWSETVKDP